MKTKRVLMGTLVAAVAMFLLGWLIYGMLLSGFMEANCDNSTARPEQEMIMWAIALSNVMSALLLSLILEWSNCFGFAGGAKVGAVTGFLIALSFDLAMYSMTTMFSNMSVIVVDSIAYGVLFAIAGGLAGMVMGRTAAKVA
jgi:hypothetical protein